MEDLDAAKREIVILTHQVRQLTQTNKTLTEENEKLKRRINEDRRDIVSLYNVALTSTL